MKPIDILNANNSYAVLGMHENPEKFAYRIYNKLKEKGKTVYGVNPKFQTIDNDVIFPTIQDVPHPVDIAVFVVNPSIGIHMLEMVKNKGIKTIWLQPGTISTELLDKAHDLGLEVIEDCVLAVYAVN